MFLHQHPYPPFIPENTSRLIVGTIPPPRFTTGELFIDDVDFCYGSKYGLLWPILDRIFSLDLDYERTNHAIMQRKNFLIKYHIGICDIIEDCTRTKIDASDIGMAEIHMRNLLDYIDKNKNISTLLFMGGNSKNGPEYLFRKLIKPLEIKLEQTSFDRPKTYEFRLNDRILKTVSLISPSSAANRSIGGDPVYKSQKIINKNYSTLDFRVEQYRKYFT
jgi:G:T/U-mismatch repair DNA glycosylase